jgi:hypothetical protein
MVDMPVNKPAQAVVVDVAVVQHRGNECDDAASDHAHGVVNMGCGLSACSSFYSVWAAHFQFVRVCLERSEWVSLGAHLVNMLFDTDNALNKALRVVGAFGFKAVLKSNNAQ